MIVTFSVGDYVAPLAGKTAQLLKSRYQGHVTVGRTGAWLKERQAYSHYAVNVRGAGARRHMRDVRIFEFDNRGFLVSLTEGRRQVPVRRLLAAAERGTCRVQQCQRRLLPPMLSASRVDNPNQRAEMVATAVLKPERMGTIDLFQYIRHLAPTARQPKNKRNPVLEEGVLSPELPGHGGVGPALCFTFTFRIRQCRFHVFWRGHGRHQFCAAQQRAPAIWAHCGLAAVDHGGPARPDLFP